MRVYFWRWKNMSGIQVYTFSPKETNFGLAWLNFQLCYMQSGPMPRTILWLSWKARSFYNGKGHSNNTRHFFATFLTPLPVWRFTFLNVCFKDSIVGNVKWLSKKLPYKIYSCFQTRLYILHKSINYKQCFKMQKKLVHMVWHIVDRPKMSRIIWTSHK